MISTCVLGRYDENPSRVVLLHVYASGFCSCTYKCRRDRYWFLILTEFTVIVVLFICLVSYEYLTLWLIVPNRNVKCKDISRSTIKNPKLLASQRQFWQVGTHHRTFLGGRYIVVHPHRHTVVSKEMFCPSPDVDRVTDTERLGTIRHYSYLFDVD